MIRVLIKVTTSTLNGGGGAEKYYLNRDPAYLYLLGGGSQGTPMDMKGGGRCLYL